MQLTINISDFKVSKNPGDVLVTYSLGSCIGVAIADPQAQVAGLLHFQLPESRMDEDRAVRQPAMFADTGLDALIASMIEHGAEKRRLRVKIAGGAKMLAGSETFDIGKRNHTAIRKALWKHGLMVDTEECGGNVPRTMYVNVADGRVMLKRKADTVAQSATPSRPRVAGGLASNRPRLNLSKSSSAASTTAASSPMRIGV
ncbi:MAG: chemotaxis protein CheD [Planctomycetota bacterium]